MALSNVKDNDRQILFMKATIKAFFDFLEDYCDAKNIGLRKFGQDFAWVRIKDDDDNNDIESIRVDLKNIVKAFFLNDNTSSQIDSFDPDPYDMGEESPETIIVIRTDYTLRNQIDMKHLIPIKAIMRDAYADKIYSAYVEAAPTGEVIGGAFAKDFAGEVKWSRALDFEVAGMPQFKGIRYIDFKDCTNIHVLFKDGESKSFLDLSTEEMERVVKGLERKLETSGKKVASKGKKPWYQGF